LKVEPWLEPRVLKDTIKLWPRSQVVGRVERPEALLPRRWTMATLIVDQFIAATG